MAYYFWKAPHTGLPETQNGGHTVRVIPGMGQWCMIDVREGEPPKGAISAADVVAMLEGKAWNWMGKVS